MLKIGANVPRMNEVEELKSPFDDAETFLAATQSARNDAGRLAIVHHRLARSKRLLSEVDPKLLVDVLTMIPHRVTDGWVPAESFIENILDGKAQFDGDELVGGPRTLTEPYDYETLEKTNPELEKSFKGLMQSLEVHRVQKRVFQHLRRNWLLDGTKFGLIAKSRLWWLLGREDELELLYPENPLAIVSEFFGQFFVGSHVEIGSTSSPIPEKAKAELVKIADLLLAQAFDQLPKKTAILAGINLGTLKPISLTSLLSTKFGEKDLETEEALVEAMTSSLEAENSSNDVRLAVHSLPLFINWLSEKHYPKIIDSDIENDPEEPAYSFQDSFPTLLACAVYQFYLSKVSRFGETKFVDFSEATFASSKLLSGWSWKLHQMNSQQIYEVVHERAEQEEQSDLALLAEEFVQVTSLLQMIEFERSKQISDIFSGFERSRLRLDAIGYTFEVEKVLKPDPVEDFRISSVLSKCLRILSEDYYHVTIEDLEAITSELNELGLWKVSSALLCLTLEAFVGENPDESFDFLGDLSLEDAAKLSKIHSEFPNRFQPSVDLAFSRLHQSINVDGVSPLVHFLPKSMLSAESNMDAETLLIRALGSQCWESLEQDIQQELILAEDLFKRLEQSHNVQGKQSAPAPLVHWSRALERLLKRVASELVMKVELAELQEKDRFVVAKIRNGNASLGELISVLLEFKKRTRNTTNATELLREFERSRFMQKVAGNASFREGLRLIGKLRNRAPHDAELNASDVLLARYTLFPTGLLKAIIQSTN